MIYIKYNGIKGKIKVDDVHCIAQAHIHFQLSMMRKKMMKRER